MIKTSLEFTAI